MRSLLMAAAFAVSALPVAAQTTLTTLTGELELPAAPSRVAVLELGALDTLLALGVQPVAVPDKLYLDYLQPAAEGAVASGTLQEPDLEALIAAQPDLIIYGGRMAEQAPSLERVAPAANMSVGTDVLADTRTRIRSLGELFGKQDEATRLTDELDAKAEAVRAAVQGKGNALVLMTNGPKVSAYGSGSRFGWIHDSLGIPQAHEGFRVEGHGDAVSFEFIAETDPDWLIVLDRGAAIGAEGASAAATLDNPLVQGTRAGKAGQIIHLPAAETYVATGGPVAMGRVLDRLAEGFGG